MKEEIKELVVDDGELIAYYKDGSFQAFDTLLQEVLDYITNLQEENVRFREIICFNEDYKSRIDKAISLLKEAGCYDEETKTFCDDVWEELPDLLNILQGENK